MVGCTLTGVLMQEVLAIEDKDLVDVEQDFKPEDTVIGDMTPYQKRVFTMAEKCRDAGLALIDPLQAMLGHVPRNEDSAKARQLYLKREFLYAILWFSLMESTNTWLENVGIRKGWKIVRFPDEGTPGL